MTKNRRIAVVILVAALTLGVSVVAWRANAPLPLTLIGAPPATLDDWRGRPVLLSFWSTACAPCLAELPLLRALAAEAPHRLQLIAIAAPSDPPANVAAIRAREKLDFPVALDLDARWARRHDVEAVPLHVLLDARGRVVARWFGALDLARLRTTLAELS